MSTQSERPVGVATTTRYLPELESLRGWAILLVMLFHVDGFMLGPVRHNAMLTTASPLMAYVRAGNTGVNLFFALSGFLLSLPIFAAARSGRSFSLRRYAARRALRILPLYYTAVIVTGTLFVLYGSSLLGVLPYFFFLNALPGVGLQMMPYSLTWWSLATEVEFYFLLPLLVLGLRWRWGGAALLVGFAAVYGAFVAGVYPSGGMRMVQTVGVSVIGRGPLFVAGIVAAWLFDRYGERLRAYLTQATWAKYGGADLALLVVLLLLGLLLRWGLTTGPLLVQQPPYHVWHVLEGILWSTVTLLLLLAPLRLKLLFANPVLEYLGLLSYSLYLLHVPILLRGLGYLREMDVVETGWSLSAVAIAFGLGLVCVAISALTYRFIERPFLVRKENLGERSAVVLDAKGLPLQRV